MKKYIVILSLVFLCGICSCFVQQERKNSLYRLRDARVTIPDTFTLLEPWAPDEGDAEAGYNYLMNGDGFRTGVPYAIYAMGQKFLGTKLARTLGYKKYSTNPFVVYKNNSGKSIATFGCIHCHAQVFDGKLVVGLGNSYSNFNQNFAPFMSMVKKMMALRYGKDSDEWKTAKAGFDAFQVLRKKLPTQMWGPTAAQKIAELMASHRDPVTLALRLDTTYFYTPYVVIPEDVPALWISKKKKAFTVNAMRQGNFIQHIVTPTILTLKDSTEAREIFERSKDVWAYIKSLEPPAYPRTVNTTAAQKGKQIFLQNCSGCHGTYDEPEFYPNKIIPGRVIGTDSLLWKYFIQYPEPEQWYNKSWFATAGTYPSWNLPQAGYVPPPLDGVWITAPYFHNGSVPTLEQVLNSDLRPRYWKRDFDEDVYNYEQVGLVHEVLKQPGGKKTYNTDIPGYGNYGHYFGDHLSDDERKALIEYLKTL